jgi:hypothetical protein
MNPATAELDIFEDFHRDLGLHFRLALLIAGSVELAEASLLDAIERLPECKDFACAQTVVVERSVARMNRGPAPSREDISRGADLLPQGLRRVMILPARERTAFVLSILLRYPVRQTGLLLGVPAYLVESLTNAALIDIAGLSD